MQQLEDTAFLPDPTSQVSRVVVQHNALAEAHYRLSLRAQKLLIRLIAELDQQSVELSEITLSLVDFAVLAAQERNDVTFAHFAMQPSNSWVGSSRLRSLQSPGKNNPASCFATGSAPSRKTPTINRLHFRSIKSSAPT
jgi:hypothetical protein